MFYLRKRTLRQRHLRGDVAQTLSIYTLELQIKQLTRSSSKIRNGRVRFFTDRPTYTFPASFSLSSIKFFSR